MHMQELQARIRMDKNRKLKAKIIEKGIIGHPDLSDAQEDTCPSQNPDLFLQRLLFGFFVNFKLETYLLFQ